jgi:hypothetical protein
MKKILFLLLLTLGLAGAADAKPYLITGRMDYTAGIEGGCWFLSAEDGEKYQVMGTQEQLEAIQVIGRQVKLQVEDANNIATTCMMGKNVRITQIVQNFGYPVDLPYVTVKTSGRIYKTKAGCWYIKTTKGQKYDLELSNIPKAKRKSGARIKNAYMKIYMAKQASDCGHDGTASFVIKTSQTLPPAAEKAMEKKAADPR